MKTCYTYIYLFIFSIVIILGCSKEEGYRYTDLQQKKINGFDPGFTEYCKLDLNSNFELNAVECSFYGDYQNALIQASRRKTPEKDPRENITFDSGDKDELIRSLEEAIQKTNGDANNEPTLQKMLDLLNTPSAEVLFADAKPGSASNYILEKAKDYHFTLINEAHYNSQHRAFTYDLLAPMWDLGYRYLAIETLSHGDSTLNERGYPIQSSGYYTKDSNFGNMVREALRLGYTMVPYETQNGNDGTLRDRDQAENILNKTWRQDEEGKVLVHAGYSHISETGDSNYEPMGFQLKNLIQQDILTIDQVTMVSLPDTIKQHQYYREAVKKSDFTEPTVFLTQGNEGIIDPINSFDIDIQVYHPETRFEQGRPNWMRKKDRKQIPFSPELLEYEGHLIQAVKRGEAIDAVPVDQFVIAPGKVFTLGPGNYDLRLINCEGDMVAILSLEVD